MNLETFKNLYISEIQDLYSAETQLIVALPKMIAAAQHPELKKAFEMHLEQTHEHVNRLDQIFTDLESFVGNEHCEAMEGLIAEGDKIIECFGDPDVKDAALIASAQRVEHYEIAAYGSTRAFAKRLDYSDHVKLLQKTLDEEGEADKMLTKIAEGSWFKLSTSINEEASAKS